MQVLRRVNIAIAMCVTAAFFGMAGSQLAARMTENQRHTARLDAAHESGVEVPVTDQSELSVGDIGDARQEPLMDLYGNEVTSAVATYTLDPSGAVYEEHSPQTEVSHLGVPTT